MIFIKSLTVTLFSSHRFLRRHPPVTKEIATTRAATTTTTTTRATTTTTTTTRAATTTTTTTTRAATITKTAATHPFCGCDESWPRSPHPRYSPTSLAPFTIPRTSLTDGRTDETYKSTCEFSRRHVIAAVKSTIPQVPKERKNRPTSRVEGIDRVTDCYMHHSVDR